MISPKSARRRHAAWAFLATAAATAVGRTAGAANFVFTEATGNNLWTYVGSGGQTNWNELSPNSTTTLPGSADTAVFADTSSSSSYTIGLPAPSATVAVPAGGVTVAQVDFGFSGTKGQFSLGNVTTALTVGTAGTTITLAGSGGNGGLSSYAGGSGGYATTGTQTVASNLIAGASQTWQINSQYDDVVVQGTISSTSGAVVTKSGAGQLEVDSNNQGSLAGYVAQGGTTVVGNDYALGTGAIQVSSTANGVKANASLLTSGGVTFGNNVSVLQNPNGVTATLGGAPGQTSSSWGGTVTLAYPVSLTGGTAGTTTFSNSIAGTGNVTKVDAGTVVLTALNTYAGTTAVTAGTLLVNGSGTTGAGDVIVSGSSGAAFGTLGGTGTAGNVSTGVASAPGTGRVTINGYGTVTAGASGAATGTLTTGAQSWNSTTGSFVAKVFDASNSSGGSSTVGNDRLVLSGLTVTPGAGPGTGFNVILRSGGNGAGFTASGPIANDAASGSNPALASGSFIVLVRDTDLSGADPFASNAALAALNVNFSSGSVPTAGSGDRIVLATLAEPGSYDLIAEDVAAPEPAGLLLAGLAGVPLALLRGRRLRAAPSETSGRQ